MSYHLNILKSESQNSDFELLELVSILQKSDSEAFVIPADAFGNEIETPNLRIGRLFFSNGMFWSLYQNDEQVKCLVKWASEFEFLVRGEEDETYTLDDENLICSLAQKARKPSGMRTSLTEFIRKTYTVFFAVTFFVLLAWLFK